MEVIYGTSNQGKVEAMKRIFRENNINLKLSTPKEIGFDEEIIEDGKTFEENSEIKANAIKKYCIKNKIKDKIIITDDAGLCIDKLNGEPGIYSARYAGKNATQIESINKILKKLENYPNMNDRSCKFVCVLTAIVLDTNEKIVSRGESLGYIAKEHGKLGGLTYGPIFIPQGFELPMSDMEEETYAKMHNHRDLALKKLISELQKKEII